MKKAIKEALLELARVAVLSVIPLAILAFEKWEFDWKTITAVGAIAVLRGVDKLLHIKGNEEEKGGSLSKGITRF